MTARGNGLAGGSAASLGLGLPALGELLPTLLHEAYEVYQRGRRPPRNVAGSFSDVLAELADRVDARRAGRVPPVLRRVVRVSVDGRVDGQLAFLLRALSGGA